MVKKIACVSCGSLKRFPHTFTTGRRVAAFLQLIFSPPIISPENAAIN